MFDADRPITKSDQDRLNRAVFSKYLARCIMDHQSPESLVVGLYGGWGVGKTSIINMVVEELQNAAANSMDSDKSIILNFSPWSYSGQDQLIYSFFMRLASALHSSDYLENKDQIIYLLELYISFFTKRPTPTPLRTKSSLLSKLGFKRQEESEGWESGRDLTLVKSELNTLLREQKHKVIIIIDNISRLEHHEIKQMFQIVKSIGDFNNTVYLLSLDKNQIKDDHDARLLEKVVQLPFEVPPISQQDIEVILADRLMHIINTVPLDAWNAEYWADIYFSSLKLFFHNCRDITRYINTLSFSYSRLRDIVNPVDFFALTAIEVFEPNVYAGIRDNKDLFSDLFEADIEKDKIRCNEIIARAQRLSRDMLLELLLRLFPRLRSMYQPNISFYHSEAKARSAKRICCPDLFNAYFRLSMQAGNISESEFTTILSLASSKQAFDQALTHLNQDDNRIAKFLDQLDSNVLQHIPLDNISSIINSLFDNGDLFPDGSPGPLNLTTSMRIHRIIHVLLRRISNSNERYEILNQAISNANKSIYIIVHELSEQGREHTEEEDVFLPIEFRDITSEQLRLLKAAAVKAIEVWANDGRLMEHPRLLPLLVAWHTWGTTNACDQYVEMLTESDRGLVLFLLATLEKAIIETETNYAKSADWQNYLKNIELFIPADKLEAHAQGIFQDGYFEKLREKEQLAVMIFLDLVKTDTTKIIPSTSV